jgi:transposase
MDTTPVVAAVIPVGLDVSKDTLDACLLLAGKRHEKQFPNDAAGHRQMLRWAQSIAKAASCHYCLEATGPYSQSVALFLVEKEQKVSVVNPARIRFFGLAQNQGNKTDKADARLIALYCQMQSPPPWRVAAPEVRLLQEMARRLHALSDLVAQEKTRAQAPGQSKAVLSSSQRVVAALEKELLRLKKEVRAHVKAHEELHRDSKLLQSVPGIGEITSWDILAEMPDVEELASAQSVAAYAGLAPRSSAQEVACAKPPPVQARQQPAPQSLLLPRRQRHAVEPWSRRIMSGCARTASPRWWL